VSGDLVIGAMQTKRYVVIQAGMPSDNAIAGYLRANRLSG
jgi:hypothetical protein